MRRPTRETGNKHVKAKAQGHESSFLLPTLLTLSALWLLLSGLPRLIGSGSF